MDRPIYLDYNATTPVDPEVVAAMRPFLEEHFGNPSSSHWYGSRPRQAVAEARRQVAACLNCRPEQVVFTSGGTEANNHAILGTARRLRGRGRHIVTTAVEHPAVTEVCRHLAAEGFETTFLPVDADGLVDPAAVAAAIRPTTVLVSVMHANNEVGTVQPVAEIARIARQRGVAVHTDAAQSVGKIAADVEQLGVDLLSLAGHKLYAPKGVGALYVRGPEAPEKFCHGAGQEMGRRAGTENVALIVGLGKACEIAARGLARHAAVMAERRDRLETGLAARLEGVRFNGHRQRRLPNTASVSFGQVAADRLLAELSGEVAASAGAACHAESVTVSHVLAAMGLPASWARGTLRFSVGRTTTAEEIDRAVAAVAAAVERLRAAG